MMIVGTFLVSFQKGWFVWYCLLFPEYKYVNQIAGKSLLLLVFLVKIFMNY